MPILTICFLRGQSPTLPHEGLLKALVEIAEEEAAFAAADGNPTVSASCAFLGSEQAGRSIKEPFSAEQRGWIFGDIADRNGWSNLVFHPLRDFATNEEWMAEVQLKVQAVCRHIFGQVEGVKVIIVDANKNGAQSNYQKMFPNFFYRQIPMVTGSSGEVVSATNVRAGWYEDRVDSVSALIPKETLEALNFYKDTELYEVLVDEYLYYQKYWEMLAQYQYPPRFKTADMMLLHQGRLLLIRRGRAPGKGLYALPGGFVDAGESDGAAAIRELKEEVGIAPTDFETPATLLGVKLFDKVGRSLRARIESLAHFYVTDTIPLSNPTTDVRERIELFKQLPWEQRCFALGELPGVSLNAPELKAGDDAADAMWFPLSRLPEIAGRLFEDHLFIIESFIGRVPVKRDSYTQPHPRMLSLD